MFIPTVAYEIECIRQNVFVNRDLGCYFQAYFLLKILKNVRTEVDLGASPRVSNPIFYRDVGAL